METGTIPEKKKMIVNRKTLWIVLLAIQSVLLVSIWIFSYSNRVFPVNVYESLKKVGFPVPTVELAHTDALESFEDINDGFVISYSGYIESISENEITLVMAGVDPLTIPYSSVNHEIYCDLELEECPCTDVCTPENLEVSDRIEISNMYTENEVNFTEIILK